MYMFMYTILQACSTSEGHELLEPFQFISDVAVENAFDVIAPLLASFGCNQPSVSKYKVSCPAGAKAFRFRTCADLNM